MAKPRHIRKFEPPMHLLSPKMANARKLDSLKRTIPKEDIGHEELVPSKIIAPMHPLLRSKMPKKPTGRDLIHQRDSVAAAQELRGIASGGVRFVPAEVDITNVRTLNPSEPAVTINFKHEKGRNKNRPKMTSYVDWMGPTALIVAYGIDPKKSSKMPLKMASAFHKRISALGLALTMDALRDAGAERILVPGTQFTRARRGAKGNDVRYMIERRAAVGEEKAVEILNQWDKLTEKQVYNRLPEIGLKKMAFHPRLIENYYADVPQLFDFALTQEPLGEEHKVFQFHDMDLKQLDPLKRWYKKD